ncbi:LOW QUALITY PROTEIN: transmembrane protein 53-like [Babylonia areolata]|uniref:LOW QUALITY PROTEIN: transmembrane protein 53-like n=1 Tax=Babylonia areolata TaxID=304850 RepID=UPI003FD4E068
MADQPFTYSVHFPDNGSSNDEEDDKQSFEVIHKSEAGDHTTPVVVLLGWAGCKEKHLRKYTPIYEKKGYITLTLIVPAKTLFFHAYKITDVAHGLLNILAENSLSNNPIIFHVFSNGGSMVYSQLAALINSSNSEKQHRLSVAGVIFDSTPGKRRILNAVKAFMSTLQFGEVFRYLLGFCLLMYLVFNHCLRLLLPGMLAMENGFQLFNSICMDACKCPQLFLYSKGDKIIMAEDVEEVIAVRKEKGVQVKSICWEDSQHVAHMRAHPEVYSKACMDFAEACFASTKPNP